MTSKSWASYRSDFSIKLLNSLESDFRLFELLFRLWQLFGKIVSNSFKNHSKCTVTNVLILWIGTVLLTHRSSKGQTTVNIVSTWLRTQIWVKWVRKFYRKNELQYGQSDLIWMKTNEGHICQVRSESFLTMYFLSFLNPKKLFLFEISLCFWSVVHTW